MITASTLMMRAPTTLTAPRDLARHVHARAALVGRVGVGEQRAQVGQVGGREHRVEDRVQEHVAVGVRARPRS
jgi:hypothetical protein